MKENKEILNQIYVTAKDLQQIIPKLNYTRALKYINEIRNDMRKKGYFVPDGRTKVALTRLFKEKFGIK